MSSSVTSLATGAARILSSLFGVPFEGAGLRTDLKSRPSGDSKAGRKAA
jgi:hypothetical protein